MNSVGSFLFLPDGVFSASHFRLRVGDFRSQASAGRLAGHEFDRPLEMASEMRTLAPKPSDRKEAMGSPQLAQGRDLGEPRGAQSFSL